MFSLNKFRLDIEFPDPDNSSGIRLPDLTGVDWATQQAQTKEREAPETELPPEEPQDVQQGQVAGNIHRSEFDEFIRDNPGIVEHIFDWRY